MCQLADSNSKDGDTCSSVDPQWDLSRRVGSWSNCELFLTDFT